MAGDDRSMPYRVFDGQSDEMLAGHGYPFGVVQHAVPVRDARVHRVEEPARYVEIFERDHNGRRRSIVQTLVNENGSDVEHEEAISELRASDVRTTAVADERDRMVNEEGIFVTEPLRLRRSLGGVYANSVAGARLEKSTSEASARSFGRGATVTPIFAVDRHIHRSACRRSWNRTTTR